MINERLSYILTPDASKLVEAGFINPETGGLTEAGRSALWLVVMQKYNKEFVASADRVIEARKVN